MVMDCGTALALPGELIPGCQVFSAGWQVVQSCTC